MPLHRVVWRWSSTVVELPYLEREMKSVRELLKTVGNQTRSKNKISRVLVNEFESFAHTKIMQTRLLKGKLWEKRKKRNRKESETSKSCFKEPLKTYDK